MSQTSVAPQPEVQQPQQQQPQQQWMQAPQRPANCPPGLEYLVNMDQLMVHQEVELVEAFTGCETNNKYQIKNVMGQPLFFAKEDNDCCTRCCCGPIRPFEMSIYDNTQQKIMHLNRPFRCATCWFPCCLQELEVFAPTDRKIGSVSQLWSVCVPRYDVKDASGQSVAMIEGPFCTMRCCADVEFKVLSANGSTEIGMISKKWSGIGREMFTDADNFGVKFPKDLDVNVKATLLAATFLIDFMFFEDKKKDAPGMAD